MNARSIKNKLEELEYILKTVKDEIHIIAITETWITKGEEEYITFKDYTSIFACRPKKIGGGAAIFIKNNIQHDVIEQYSDNFNSIVCVQLHTNNTVWTISNIYRAPSKLLDHVSHFITKLNEHISKLPCTNTIITGDFNFNVLEYDDRNTQTYINTMLSNSFYICDDSTITRSISQTSLDHIHTNHFTSTIQLNYAPYDLLDHQLIFIEVINTNVTAMKIKKTFTVQKTNFYKLKQSLINAPIILNTATNVDNVYDEFITVLQKHINKNTCTKTMKTSIKSKPWYDKEMEQSIKIKQYWYRKKIKNPNNTFIKAEYNIARNNVTKRKQQKKQHYFQNGFTQSANNNKATWKYIKQTIYNGYTPIKKDNLSLIPNTNHFIEQLNKYIANIGTELLKMHTQVNVFYFPSQTTSTFKFRDCTQQNTKKIINNLKNTKSCGQDGITTEIIKQNLDQLIPNITHIINASMKSGIFPKSLKITKVVPIHKTGAIDEYKNYRPLCILSVMDKIIEKYINEQLLSYLEENKLIYKKQYGFRKNASTNTALFDFTTSIQKHLDVNRKVGVIFIDLKKAFETIDRDILLKKLNGYGVKGNEYYWFKSYLNDRQQYIEHQQYTTSKLNVNTGLAQGTNLSTTLFILYINNIQKTNMNGTMYLYADDMAIVYDADNITQLQTIMNSDCIKLKKWMNENKLTINTDKTKYMIFRNKIPTQILYNGTELESVPTIKYLGVIIDDELSWKQHMIAVKNKTAPIAGICRRVANYIPHNVKRQFFFSMFHSKLTYAAITWITTYSTQLAPLQVIQNKALRNLYQHDNNYNTRDMHKEHSIMMLDEYAKYILATHIYNLTNNCIVTNTVTTKNNEIHQYNTRSADQINVGNAYTTRYGIHQGLRQAITIYNKIPLEIRVLEKNKFKVKLKEYFSANVLSQN